MREANLKEVFKSFQIKHPRVNAGEVCTSEDCDCGADCGPSGCDCSCSCGW